MKNLFSFFFFFVMTGFCQAQTISLDPTLPQRSIDRFYGVNGMNSLQVQGGLGNGLVNDILKQDKPGIFRYPGGTVGNYFDWQEGWFLRNRADKGCLSTRTTYTKMDRLAPVFNGTVLNTSGALYLDDLKSALLYSGSNPLFVLNPLTSDKYYQLAMLLAARELNIPVNRVEIGNELYLEDCGYLEKFNTATDYATTCQDWAAEIKTVYPGATISVDAANVGSSGNADDHLKNWNPELYSSMATALPEAFTIHNYRKSGIDATLDYHSIFGSVGSSMSSLNTYINMLGNNKPIWITEYNLDEKGGSTPIHGTWFHGLYDAYTTLRYLENNRITACNLHTLLGNYVFSDYFSNDIGFNPIEGYEEWGCIINPFPPPPLPLLPTPTPTKAFTRTSLGIAMQSLSTAMSFKTYAQRLSFSIQGGAIPTLTDNYKALYGWSFGRLPSINNKTSVILNLSDQAFTNMDVSALGFDASDLVNQYNSQGTDYIFTDVNSLQVVKQEQQQSCTPPTTVTFIEDQSIGSAFSTSSASINLPPYSITFLRGAYPEFVNRAIDASATEVIAGTSVNLYFPFEPGYTYQWNTGQSGNAIQVTPQQGDNLYTLSVYDANNTFLYNKSITISGLAKPTTTFSYVPVNGSNCPSAQFKLQVQVDYPPTSVVQNNTLHFVYITSPDVSLLGDNNHGLAHQTENFTTSTTNTIQVLDELTVSPGKTTTYTVYITDGNIAWHETLKIGFDGELILKDEYRFCADNNQNPIELQPQYYDGWNLLPNITFDGNPVSCQFGNNSFLINGLPFRCNGTLTFTINSGNCSREYQTQIIVAECCANGSNHVNNAQSSAEIFSQLGLTPQPDTQGQIIDCLSGLGDIYLSGKSHVNSVDKASALTPGNAPFISEIEFRNCNLFFSEASTLEAEPGYGLRFVNCNLTNACGNYPWQGIVADNASVEFVNDDPANTSTTISNAEYAVELKRGSTLDCQDQVFTNNLVSIKANDVDASGFNDVDIIFKRNQIQGLSGYNLAPYIGQMIPYHDRPLSGMMLNNVVLTMNPTRKTNTGPFSPNVFSNLNCGINAENSIVWCNKQRFENILADNAYANPVRGVGIYSKGAPDSYAALMVRGNPNQNIYEFDNCDIAIETENSTLDVLETEMNVNNWGVFTKSNLAKPVLVKSSNIVSHSGGIALLGQDQASDVEVIDNDIQTSYQSNMFGEPGILMADYVYAFADRIVNVNCNYVETGSSYYGIHSMNVAHSVFNHNIIHQTDARPKNAGLLFQNSSQNLITNNEVNGPINTKVNSGIAFDKCSNNTISYNKTNWHSQSFSFWDLSPNNGQNFKVNEMSNYYIGLYVEATYGIGSIVNKGNKWLSEASSFKEAMWLDPNSSNPGHEPSQSEIFNNRIIFNSFGPDQTRIPTKVNPLNWPAPNAGNDNLPSFNFLCTSVINTQYAINSSFTEMDSIIASSELQYPLFEKEADYFAQQDLLRKISELLNDSTITADFINYFLSSQSNTNGLSLSLLNQLNNRFTSEEFVSLIYKDSVIRHVMEGFSFDSTVCEQSKATKNSILSYSSNVSMIDDRWRTLLPTLNQQNNAIISSNLSANYEALCNQGILASSANSGILNPDLTWIAQLCPLIGGKATYRARAKLVEQGISSHYFDQFNCNLAVQARRGKIVATDNSTPTFHIIGNPLANGSKLVFDKETESESDLVIKDAIGKVAFTSKIPSGTIEWKFPEINFTPGLFYCKIQGSMNAGVEKLFVISPLAK